MAQDDISNTTLALLLVVAIVVSVGGTYVVLNRSPGITGLFTGTNTNGTVSFTQQGVLSIRLTDAQTTFGNVTSTANGTCVINTEGRQGNCTSTLSNDYMELENDGNVPASVTINSTKDRNQSFRLGTGGNQSFKASNSESGACAGTLTSVYTPVPNASDPHITVCTALRSNDSEDLLRIDYQLQIGTDLPQGNYTENVTFWASLA